MAWEHLGRAVLMVRRATGVVRDARPGIRQSSARSRSEPKQHPMPSFLAELRRRNVVRVAGLYAVVGWLLVQVVVSIKAPLGLPGWTDTLVIVLVGLGFPVALL